MLTLVIGNKNISSWSLRAWLVIKHLELPFTEVKLMLDTPEFKPAALRYSPVGRVPVLVDDGFAVWDSLAIAEYLNEKSGGRGWPANDQARAHARAISAEMHSGFAALRQIWPMQATQRLQVPLTAAAADDVARVDRLWQDCRAKHGERGPWLFGAYSIADAMYAPVVLRFNTYQANVSSPARAYIEQTLADPHLRAWLQQAREEVGAA